MDFQLTLVCLSHITLAIIFARFIVISVCIKVDYAEGRCLDSILRVLFSLLVFIWSLVFIDMVRLF